ncbi:hypothetical protein JVU11DRAFT_1669 [Chiua virens]|nr:hypothetical protein JVU11DRAFT_1669 [Chiua virens]
MASLTSDIQRALQLAVGEANNPFIQSQSNKSPKNKRARNDSTGDVDPGTRDKKKKKNSTLSTHEQDNTLVTHSPAHDPDVPPETDKEAVDALTGEIDQQDISVDSQQASSAAFLNAVVAAASATSDAQPIDIPSYQASPPYHDQQILPHQPPFIYPPVHYDFHDPSQFGEPSSQGHPVFTGLVGPLPDFHFASNDDIIRAIQDMDVSKIASVLKSLGDAAAASASVTNPPPFVPPPPPMPSNPIPPQVNLPSTSTGLILSSVPKSTKSSHKRVLDMSLPGPEQPNPEHAHILANKWMNASKLAELVKTQGLVYKKGKFSAIEEEQLKNAIETFKASRGITDEQILEIIFQKNEKGKENAFCRRYSATSDHRRISPCQEGVSSLKNNKVNGHQMKTIYCGEPSPILVSNGKSPCYRPMEQEEEEELTKIVTEMTVNQGKDIDNDVFWGIVSEKMGNRRGRQQCRIKWTDSLSKTVKNEGQKPRWSPQDAYILVHKVDSLKARDDTEIDWKTLTDPDWNLWSAHSLQRRWLTMKRSIKGYEEMTHQEIMDILRVKKAQLPPASSARRRKVTSAASIDEQDILLDSAPGNSTAFQTPVPEVESVQDDSAGSLDDE